MRKPQMSSCRSITHAYSCSPIGKWASIRPFGEKRQVGSIAVHHIEVSLDRILAWH